MAASTQLGGYLSALFDLPNFIYDYISIDLMHVSDLGVMLYLLANVFYELAVYEMGGNRTDPREQLEHLLTCVRQGSKAVGLAQPAINSLTWSMIKKPKSKPKFALKASESRNLLKVTRHMLEHYFPRETERQQQRYHCIRVFTEMYDHLKDWKGNASGRAAASCGRKGLLMMALMNRDDIREGGHLHRGFDLYNFKPKMHLMVHCLESEIALAGNPRDAWCYCDESELGAAIQVAESLHKGALHRSVIRRHRLL